VAEELMNPFGEDDDNFDINSLIDSLLKVLLYSCRSVCLSVSVCTHVGYRAAIWPLFSLASQSSVLIYTVPGKNATASILGTTLTKFSKLS